MNIGSLQPSGSQIVKPMRDVCGTKENISLARLNHLVADREERPAFSDDENLIVGMNMPARPFPNFISREEEHGNPCPDFPALETPSPDLIVRSPIISMEDDQCFLPGMAKYFLHDFRLSNLQNIGDQLWHPSSPAKTEAEEPI